MNPDISQHLYRTLWLSGEENIELDDVINFTLASSQAKLKGVPELNDTWRRRYRTALQFTLPAIASTLGSVGRADLSRISVLEVGCGSGAKAVALSQIFGSYTGIDIDSKALAVGRNAASCLGLRNIDLRQLPSERILDLLESEGKSFDVFVLYAVIEHLTIQERLNLLRACWLHLKPGGVLLVGELPNRLCPVDHHSSYLAYLDSLPEELALLYGQRSPREYFKNRVYSAPDPVLELYRVGRGASYHEFELSITDCDTLASHIVWDAWSGIAVNHQPVRSYERSLLQEFVTIRNDNTTLMPRIPSGFARYWIDMTIMKGDYPPLPPPIFVDPKDGDQAAQMSLGSRFYSTKAPLTVTVPSGRDAVTIGFLRPSLSSEVTVTAENGAILFQGSGETLARATGDHWSPHVYKRMPLSLSRSLEVRSAAGDAFVGNIYFR